MSPSNIVSGPPQSVPDVSIGKLMFDKILSHKDKLCQVDALTGKSMTFDQVLKGSISVAEGLKLHGLQAGQVIAVMSENSVEFFMPVLASFFLGATCTMVSPNYNTRELLHAVNISQPSIIFSSPSSVSTIRAARSCMPYLKAVVLFGEQSENDCIAFSSLLHHRTLDINITVTNSDQYIAAAFSTSGTTGLPKYAAITSRNLVACIAGFIDPRVVGMDPTHTLLGIVPLFHIFGFVLQLACLVAGIKVVVMSKFDGDAFLQTIQDHKVTFLAVVPTLMTFLANEPAVDKYDTCSLKEIWCGAAPLPEELQLRVAKRLGVHYIRQGYGSTETLNTLHTPVDHIKLGSSGVLLPGMHCKVVDIISGRTVGPNEQGELCFKGPQVVKGYLHNSRATAESFDSEDFYHSGDEDGFFFIIDRIKDLIKYKGFQVAPSELEALLLLHPSVKEVAVIGIPDHVAGELPKAFVVTKPYCTVSRKELMQFIADKVSSHKRLRGGVEFVSSLPKSSSGKMMRRQLRQGTSTSKL